MPAAYPSTERAWTTKVDFLDQIFAVHINTLQDEIKATETTVGIFPQRAVADPAGRTPDYGTVTGRINSAARGEPLVSYRSRAELVDVPPNVYYRPALIPSEDSHGAATETGLVLPETGLWVFTIKADFKPVEPDGPQQIVRIAALDIDGEDVGLRDLIIQTTANRDDMSCRLTWQETLPAGTHIAVALHIINADSAQPHGQANVYLRAHLARCLSQGGSGLPSPVFQTDPPPPVTHPSGTVLYPPSPVPTPTKVCGPPYVFGVDPVSGNAVMIDSCGHMSPTRPSPSVTTGVASAPSSDHHTDGYDYNVGVRYI